jgi:tRNA-Thr(GGU) m(6)t(6)A37 methyltransferase TsaA
MKIEWKPIGFLRTDEKNIPRHWTVSEVEGTLIIDEKYLEGCKDINAGQRIVAIFHFHQSPGFTPDYLSQTPPNQSEKRGVFSICSPIRPNPIGMSVLDVLGVENNTIHVKGVDMVDGTPILDIKPYVQDKTGVR